MIIPIVSNAFKSQSPPWLSLYRHCCSFDCRLATFS